MKSAVIIKRLERRDNKYILESKQFPNREDHSNSRGGVDLFKNRKELADFLNRFDIVYTDKDTTHNITNKEALL